MADSPVREEAAERDLTDAHEAMLAALRGDVGMGQREWVWETYTPEGVAIVLVDRMLKSGLLALTASDRSEIDQLRAANEALIMLVARGVTAFDLTRQYVDEELLPALEGWSWWDWVEAATNAIVESEPVSTGLAPEPEPGDVKEDVTASIESVAGASPQAAPEATT